MLLSAIWLEYCASQKRARRIMSSMRALEHCQNAALPLPFVMDGAHNSQAWVSTALALVFPRRAP
jgi:hypothetical protein